jgi:recombination protein RecR
MHEYPKPLAKLISELSRLPGIGGKSAQRLAFFMMGDMDDKASGIADAIYAAKEELKYCSVCGNYTDEDPCAICSDANRDHSKICIVESPKDVSAIERTKEYKGLYHVLHGAISPMEGKGAGDIKTAELIVRLQETDEVKELIIATNPTMEGEVTANYIAKLIKPTGIKVSRIAHGVSVGGELEMTNVNTLVMAFDGRREL